MNTSSNSLSLPSNHDSTSMKLNATQFHIQFRSDAPQSIEKISCPTLAQHYRKYDKQSSVEQNETNKDISRAQESKNEFIETLKDNVSFLQQRNTILMNELTLAGEYKFNNQMSLMELNESKKEIVDLQNQNKILLDTQTNFHQHRIDINKYQQDLEKKQDHINKSKIAFKQLQDSQIKKDEAFAKLKQQNEQMMKQMEQASNKLDLSNEVAEIKMKKFGFGECQICMTDGVYINNVLCPCLHNGMCNDCAPKLVGGNCPLCRVEVTKWAKIKELDDQPIQSVILMDQNIKHQITYEDIEQPVEQQIQLEEVQVIRINPMPLEELWNQTSSKNTSRNQNHVREEVKLQNQQPNNFYDEEEDQDSNEMQNLPAYYKKHECRNYKQNKYCSYGDRCSFAHGFSELKRHNVNWRLYKTQWCSYGENCTKKSVCSYAHNEDEKRKYPK